MLIRARISRYEFVVVAVILRLSQLKIAAHAHRNKKKPGFDYRSSPLSRLTRSPSPLTPAVWAVKAFEFLMRSNSMEHFFDNLLALWRQVGTGPYRRRYRPYGSVLTSIRGNMESINWPYRGRYGRHMADIWPFMASVWTPYGVNTLRICPIRARIRARIPPKVLYARYGRSIKDLWAPINQTHCLPTLWAQYGPVWPNTDQYGLIWGRTGQKRFH